MVSLFCHLSSKDGHWPNNVFDNRKIEAYFYALGHKLTLRAEGGSKKAASNGAAPPVGPMNLKSPRMDHTSTWFQ